MYFKYYGFFTVNVANAATTFGLHVAPPLIQVVLPVGISFYTFMAIAYIVDIYRGRLRGRELGRLSLYLSFFPHLVAGPIVRPNELIPQLDVRRDPDTSMSPELRADLRGLFKKVVIADYLAADVVDPVFADPPAQRADVLAGDRSPTPSRSTATSVATPTSRSASRSCSGFRFPQNFDSPYSARPCRTSGAAGT